MKTFFITNRIEINISRHLQGAGFVEISNTFHTSPLAGIVRIIEVRWVGQVSVPHDVRLGTSLYTRILDRFYVPVPPDPTVTTALFDAVATDYEQLVDMCRNYANIERLLGVVVRPCQEPGSTLHILDLGCGPGLSALVLAQRALDEQAMSRDIALIGTDTSAAMLALARSRGLRVLSHDEWRKQPPESYDGIIASYVLHCGLTDDEWKVLSQQLTGRGLFAANYHHADKESLARVMAQASRAGLYGSTMRDDTPQWAKDPVLVFKHTQEPLDVV